MYIGLVEMKQATHSQRMDVWNRDTLMDPATRQEQSPTLHTKWKSMLPDGQDGTMKYTYVWMWMYGILGDGSGGDGRTPYGSWRKEPRALQSLLPLVHVHAPSTPTHRDMAAPHDKRGLRGIRHTYTLYVLRYQAYILLARR